MGGTKRLMRDGGERERPRQIRGSKRGESQLAFDPTTHGPRRRFPFRLCETIHRVWPGRLRYIVERASA